MTTLIAILFLFGYAFIAFEHTVKINKTATALLLGTLCWTVWILSEASEAPHINHRLAEQLSEVAQILFFLLGAMTIVEIVDAHQGFKIITNRITTRSLVKLAWLFTFITFFLSAVLDNLTTTIVMISLAKKLIPSGKDRLTIASLIVIAANAGGAWTPIGDITTTMLWIGQQISTLKIMQSLFLPALVCALVPLLILSISLRRNLQNLHYNTEKALADEKIKGSRRMLALGVGGLIFVPIFKLVTHLPPYMGMLFSLSIIWIASELLHVDKSEEEKKPYSATYALTRIDAASVLFFLGILLAIGAMQGTGLLIQVAEFLSHTLNSEIPIAFALGLLSAIVDNVPLVAAIQKMYPLATESINSAAYLFAQSHPEIIEQGRFVFEGVTYYLTDAPFWEMIAFSAGTGGSCLIIGSAAGVAAMGIEKINFIWYLKNVAWLALLGYVAGFLTYLVL